METTIARLLRGRNRKDPRRVTVMAMFEDAATGERVDEFCRNLMRLPAWKSEIVKQMWLFNELRVPRLMGIAAEEAAAADLVVVSMHHSDSLPLEVTACLKAWLGQKTLHSICLVALFDPVYQGDSTAVHAYLKEIARAAHLEFIAQADEVPENRLI